MGTVTGLQQPAPTSAELDRVIDRATAGYQPLLARLAHLSGARGAKALWAITCCIIAEGVDAVQWSRADLARRTGCADSALDEAIALGEAARILARRPGMRAPGVGGLPPTVLALHLDDDTPRRGETRMPAARGIRPPRATVTPFPRAGVDADAPHCGEPSRELTTVLRMDSHSGGQSSHLDDGLARELADWASEATADPSPAMMAARVGEVVDRLTADEWLPGAIRELVAEAVRRSHGTRQPARHCWRTLGRLVDEGWRPTHGLVRRPPVPPSPAPPHHELEAEIAPLAGDPGASTPDEPRAPFLPDDAVIAGPSGRWPLGQLRRLLLDDLRRRDDRVTLGRVVERLEWRSDATGSLALALPPWATPAQCAVARQVLPDLLERWLGPLGQIRVELA